MEKKTKRSKTMVKKTRIARVCALLNKQKVKYLVIGGEACILHGLIRTTNDVDILLMKDKKNAVKVLQALSNLTWGIAKEISPDEILNKPITIIGDQPKVDIHTVAWKISYEDAESTKVVRKVEGVKIPFVSIDTLIKTKNTGRLQDKADIEKLKQLKSISVR